LLLPACGGNSSVTGSLNCTTAPSAPTGLAASSTTSTGTTLNWTAAAVGANCSVTGYTVYENGKSIGTPTATTFNVTGLTAATMYSFTVAASDSTGLSAQSSAISVTTGPGGTPTGTYTVTITGIGSDANTTTQMATTTLTVN
ncbi:MAG: fibronectin type III domain-containing protein, partial [Candidatus Sulfotelmatobacter sp.]